MPNVMQTPRFPVIPIPEATPASLQRAMSAVIQTLTMLTGSDPKSRSGDKADRQMAHVFIQSTQPEALNPGDFWLCQQPKVSLSVWNGAQWVHLVDAP
jgi:hypothetical protein